MRESSTREVQTKFAFKKEYLKQGETKDRKKWENLLEELCHRPRAFESKGSKDRKIPRGTEKSLLSDCHFTWICWSLLLFCSTNLPVEHILLALLKDVLKEWNQDCPLFSEEYSTVSKSNHLGCCLCLPMITLFTGSNSERECRLAECLWHQHSIAKSLFSRIGHYCQKWPSPVRSQSRKGLEITGKLEWTWADLQVRKKLDAFLSSLDIFYSCQIIRCMRLGWWLVYPTTYFLPDKKC